MTGMNQEDMLSELSQSQKDTHSTIPLISRVVKFIETESTKMVARGRKERGTGKLLFKDVECPFER